MTENEVKKLYLSANDKLKYKYFKYYSFRENENFKSCCIYKDDKGCKKCVYSAHYHEMIIKEYNKNNELVNVLRLSI